MLPETVREAADRFGDAPALVDEDGRALSYAELHERSDEVAAGLRHRGIGEGAVVGLVMPSVPDYVVAYVAAAKLGATTAGINPRLTAAERHALLDLAGCALVIEGTDAVDELRVPGGSSGSLDDDPERAVAIVFTSGTTGRPKGAVFTNRQLAAIAELDVAGAWGDGSLRMMASTSLAHVGFMTKLPWYLRMGGPIFLLRRWTAAGALRVASEQRLTTLGGVPTQVALMLREPSFDTHDLSSIATIVLGGGPASLGLLREASERIGAPVSVRFSSTETGGCGTGTAFEDPIDESMGVGRPRGSIEVTIRDADGRMLGDGEVGEICVRTPSAMAAYHRDPDATAGAFTDDGSVRTGDLGYLDAAGRLHLAGRLKEMYVRGGYNVYPAEVEAVLETHPSVADVAVVSRDHEVMGELGVAFVVGREGAGAVSLDELRRFASERLGSHKLPDEVVIVDELPLTPMHKVDKQALRRRLD